MLGVGVLYHQAAVGETVDKLPQLELPDRLQTGIIKLGVDVLHHQAAILDGLENNLEFSAVVV
jgi:hypothetical protein